ncbi:MAG: AAA family ATPase [Thaumarchaeota archaeon]|nr:AAA family ATPase [Nitrososphaerota archaeon]
MTQIEAKNLYFKLENEISKIVVGKSETIKLLSVGLLADGHVLLEGVPGVAKTLIAKAFAKALGLDFKRIQLTPDMLPADITGTFIFNAKDQQFIFREGPIFGNVVLADEINRAIPKTQSALLEAMQEKQVTVEGVTRLLPDPFIVIATQNPVEMQGTYPLPEAQLDRFMLRLIVEVPEKSDEIEIVNRATAATDLSTVQAVVSGKEVTSARNQIRESVTISHEVMDYVVSLVGATRLDEEKVLLGGSPRASVHLLAASRALAAINGKSYVTPDDVKSLTFHALNHRILLSPEYVLRSARSLRPYNYDAVNNVITTAISATEPPR